MSTFIDGVETKKENKYLVCHINYLSDELKNIIKRNFQSYCHGNKNISSGLAQFSLFSYQATIDSFLERYKSKTYETQVGMIGELLTHILITELFDTFDVASAFFNLEEKSIKKGFDLLIYDTEKNNMWITEVKSGSLHKGKNSDQTTKDLLSDARDDLRKRLNEKNKQLWYNAINHVMVCVQDTKDYKNSLLTLLANDGSAAEKNIASSDDKNIILVSSLFANMSDKVSKNPAISMLTSNIIKSEFSDVIVISIQKSTYENVSNFLNSELG